MVAKQVTEALRILAGLLIVGVTSANAAEPGVIDKARAEGKLVFYSGVERQAAEAITTAFHKKYPFIATEVLRASSSKLATRLDAEIQANRVGGDVFEFSLLYLTTALEKRNEILKYDSSTYQNYSKQYVAPGYWAATGLSNVIIIYNTNVVDAANVPHSWWDLSKPYWNGKLAIDNLEVSGTGYNWLVAVVNDQSLGWKYIEALGKNHPTLERGHAGIAQKVAAGEYGAAIEMSDFHLHNLRLASASIPVKGVWPKEGVPQEPWTAGILKRAPHPNAARLFLDFLLSKEGQTIYVKAMGWQSARDDAPLPEYKEMPAKIVILQAPISAEEALKVRPAYIAKWKQLWGLQ